MVLPVTVCCCLSSLLLLLLLSLLLLLWSDCTAFPFYDLLIPGVLTCVSDRSHTCWFLFLFSTVVVVVMTVRLFFVSKHLLVKCEWWLVHGGPRTHTGIVDSD